jgi:SHS2 domain-containing protein
VFEFFDHTADAGFRVLAPDRETLYRDAARALFSLIVEDLDTVEPLEQVHLELSGNGDDDLLFDWLNELLYLYDTRGLVFSRYALRWTETGLEADVAGAHPDPDRLLHEVKAITYHDFEVNQTEPGWEARVIVDI